MKFGKLPSVDAVDFKFKPPPTFTSQVLAEHLRKPSKPKVYFGCTGWSMKEWVGSYYPERTKPKGYLAAYNRQFSTIELNTTHYRIPTQEMIKTWYEATDSDFKFSPKIPQSISHKSDLDVHGDKIPYFCKQILGLKEKLGTSFMQLPPHFSPDRFAILVNFLRNFPTKKIPLAIEVRHPNWFSDPTALNELLHLFKEHQVGTVITDVAGRRDVLHMGLSTPMLMLRFVGNDMHPTDYQRVDDWVACIKTWLEQGLKEVYFFSHQPDNIRSPEMCTYFIEQLEKETRLRFSKKTKPLDSGQMTLF